MLMCIMNLQEATKICSLSKPGTRNNAPPKTSFQDKFQTLKWPKSLLMMSTLLIFPVSLLAEAAQDYFRFQGQAFLLQPHLCLPIFPFTTILSFLVCLGSYSDVTSSVRTSLTYPRHAPWQHQYFPFICFFKTQAFSVTLSFIFLHLSFTPVFELTA